MRLLPNWVVWRYETRGGKQTKVPYNPRRPTQKASASDPGTWGSFSDALPLIGQRGVAGVGFQFGNTPYCGIDTDHKRHDGEIHPIARELIERLDSYTEISPSGKGQHIIIKGAHPSWATHKKMLADDLEVEVYSEGRFFTITGQVIQTPFIEDRQEALEKLLIEWGMVKAVPLTRDTSTGLTASFTGSDSELWERIWRSNSGQDVRALADGDLSRYGGDRSRADFAMCGHLCFWTNGNPERMDAMFRTTALMRPKWDAKHRGDGSTYGQMTIQEVLNRWDGQGYDPTHKDAQRTEIKGDWSSPELLIRGRQHLASSGSHGRTVNSYTDLWHALVQVITAGSYVTQANGTLTLTSAGMTELYARAGGRPMDRRQQLAFLHSQGMCGPLIRQEPSNPRSAWLLTVPANPAELPFSTSPRGSLPALPLNTKPRARDKETARVQIVDKTYERENRVCTPLAGFSAFWTLFALSVLREAKVSDVADLAAVKADRAYRHLRTLPTVAVQSGRLWKSVLTPEQVGALYLQLTAPQVAHRKRRILEDRLQFHQSKFEYLASQGLHMQARIHFHYAERYRHHLEAA